MADQELRALGQTGTPRLTMASLSKELDLQSKELDLQAKELGELKDSIARLKEQMSSTVREALTEALSAHFSVAQGAHGTPPSVASAERNRTPSAIPAGVQDSDSSKTPEVSNERMKELDNKHKFMQRVQSSLKGEQVLNPRDLRFRNTLDLWSKQVKDYPEEWARETVQFAFGGSALQLYNNAFTNGALKDSSSAKDRWAWATERFWSQSVVNSLRSEYRGRKLRRDENLSKYHAEMRSLAAALGVPDEDLKVDFIEGLPQKYRSMANIQGSLQEYEGLLHVLLREHGEKLDFSRPFMASAKSQSVHAVTESVEEGTALESHGFTADAVSAIADRVARILQNPSGIVCYTCKETGHFARDCPQRDSKDGRMITPSVKESTGTGSA